MTEENALDRLMKEAQLDGAEPKYSLDEMIEDDENFLDKMSTEATSSLKNRIQPEKLDSDEEEEVEEEQTFEEEKVEKVVEQPKKTQQTRKLKQNKKDKTANKYEEFLNSLANECIDIMIQSGVSIHNFNDNQMNIIWDYIKSKISHI